MVPGRRKLTSQRRRLERLDVGPQPGTGPDLGHGGDVVGEGVAIDDQGGRGQVRDLHGQPPYRRSRR